MPKKYNRKTINFSIKKQLQIRLFIKVLGVALIGIGLMAAIFYFYSNREIGGSYKQFHVHAKNFLDYLLPAVVLSIVAAVLFATAITLFFPLTIAGPLYRIERDIKDRVAEGDLSVRFNLRKGDEVDDLANALNISFEKIGGTIRNMQDTAVKLKSIASDKDPEIKKLVNDLNEEVQKFKL